MANVAETQVANTQEQLALEQSQNAIDDEEKAKEALADNTNEKDEHALETALTVATDYDVAAIVSLVLSGTAIAVEVGATLPIIGTAIALLDRLIKQYKAYGELNELFETVQESIINCELMIRLAKETIEIFKKKLVEFFSDPSLREEFKTTITELQRYKLNSSIEIKIETSLKKIMDTLTKFDNTTKSNFQKFKDFLSKSFQGNFYISFLKNEISMLLLHITSYNSQFVWILFLNERKLSKITKRVDDKEVNLSDIIFDEITKLKSFEEYLINNTVSPAIKQEGGRRRKHRKSRGKKRTKRRHSRKTK